MKKIILFFIACVTSVCVYANTCTYDGVAVSLYSESVECTASSAMITVTTNKTNVSKVRCQIEVNGKREWVTIDIYDGTGTLDIKSKFRLTPNMSYKVKLVAGAGQCY